MAEYNGTIMPPSQTHGNGRRNIPYHVHDEGWWLYYERGSPGATLSM